MFSAAKLGSQNKSGRDNLLLQSSGISRLKANVQENGDSSPTNFSRGNVVERVHYRSFQIFSYIVIGSCFAIILGGRVSSKNGVMYHWSN